MNSGALPAPGSSIEKTEDRGITLRQLLALWDHVKKCCVKEGWTSTNPGKRNERLTPETVTLYDLNAFVIMPATLEKRTSYVELVVEAGECEVVRCPQRHLRMTKVGERRGGSALCDGCGAEGLERHFQCVRCAYKYCERCADGAKAAVGRAELQRPEWFVSHWWGEPVVLFIACLMQHAKDRFYRSPDDESWLDTPYWVCAYANNQHELGSDVTADPQSSSFRKAMRRARGTVSVIDAIAETYKRIWCDFEV